MINEEIKARIENLLLSTDRKGIDRLLQHMSSNGFYASPCSGAYHLAVPGGLAEHSLNVYEIMVKLNESLKADIPGNSIKIIALLHDLGKMGQFGKSNYVENLLKSGKRSDSKPYETNKELLYVPHEIRSIQIASQYINLSEAESYSILQHNGMYSELKYSYSGKETKESMLVHWADLYASRITEV